MYRALQGDTALGEDVLYRVLQVYCGRRGCDIEGVAGITASGGDVMYSVLL